MEWLEDLEWIKGTYDWADVFSSDITNLLGVVDLVLNIFMLLAFIGMWYWIYTLAKKMWVKHAWMWWIPLFQYYTMCQVAGVKFFKHVVLNNSMNFIYCCIYLLYCKIHLNIITNIKKNMKRLMVNSRSILYSIHYVSSGSIQI